MTQPIDNYRDERNESRDHIAELVARAEKAEAENVRLRADKERLDWLDSLNAKLNTHYGTSYGWKFIISLNVVRLMSKHDHWGNGYVADLDLHDSAAHGVSVREAIDVSRKYHDAEGGSL